jgi:hypothetical protein
MQDYHERTEWINNWAFAAEQVGEPVSVPPTIPKPILTRWWTVLVRAGFALKHWEILEALCHGVIQRDPTKSAVNQIASGNQALMKTPVIKVDVDLIALSGTFFFNEHFEWLQHGDPVIGNRPGFLSRHMAVRYFIIESELEPVYHMEGWRRMAIFSAYRESIASSLSNQERLQQVKKTNCFLMLAKRTHSPSIFDAGCRSYCFFLYFQRPQRLESLRGIF